ncbi:MAG: lysis system i-spanin subunit Rz [Parvibaculum sp.]|uniref:lysis system i-spanin subunit Rz n=1 Tax=Parvibaculum sp. TaxID=2024848 RepID=UPI003C738C57
MECNSGLLADRLCAILHTQRRSGELVQKEIQDAKLVEDKLRADVDSGARKLRIAVAAASLPGHPGTTSGSDDNTVELAASARSAYYDLRAEINQDQATINACQAYARAVSQPYIDPLGPLGHDFWLISSLT